MINTPRNTTIEAAGKSSVGTDLLQTPETNGLIERKSFYFAAAAAKAELCVLDLATTTYGLGTAAKKSPNGTDDHPLACGFTEEAVVAGTWADLVIYGPVNSKANANLDAGDPVCGDTAADGTVREFVEGTDGNKVGVALEADGAVTAGYARIFAMLK